MSALFPRLVSAGILITSIWRRYGCDSHLQHFYRSYHQTHMTSGIIHTVHRLFYSTILVCIYTYHSGLAALPCSQVLPFLLARRYGSFSSTQHRVRPHVCTIVTFLFLIMALRFAHSLFCFFPLVPKPVAPSFSDSRCPWRSHAIKTKKQHDCLGQSKTFEATFSSPCCHQEPDCTDLLASQFLALNVEFQSHI